MSADNLIEKLKTELQKASPLIVDQLNVAINSIENTLFDKITPLQIAGVQFEYDFETLEICYYPFDCNFNIIGTTEFLINPIDETLISINPDNSIIIKERNTFFEEWFINCWHSTKTNKNLVGIFSVHDTIWLTNMESKTIIREDDVPQILRRK